MMGIETIILKKHKHAATKIGSSNSSFKCDNSLDCIESRHLLSSDKILQVNSRLLTSLANEILLNFSQTITVERKFTSDERILAGITIDWRHIKDWRSFKTKSELHLKN